MIDFQIAEAPLLPFLPSEVPWGIRQFCYAARKISRGYGRVLPALARLLTSLQAVTLDTPYCGQLCVDFRELICLPIFVHGCYKHQVREDRILASLLHEGMRVFDIGANVGYYTAFFSRRVKECGLVVAVEPIPRAIRILEKTALLCGANAVVAEAAIGSEPGQAEIEESLKLGTDRGIVFGPSSKSGRGV